MSYDMGYYGGGDGFDADEYEIIEEEPQQRRRSGQGQGLRAWSQRVQAENADLKRRLAEMEDATRDLLGSSPQAAGAPQNNIMQAGGNPHSPILTQAEMQQLQRYQSMGMYGAPNQGSEAEMISRINNAKNADELTEYLRSQGMNNTLPNYNGTGY
ncbi:hypothetical protein [Streptomyces mirabilis]|uniref:hypothetical protein n=1 Tax=Streptomyces mirabilis TaxID=68239 RepID=UPI0033A1901A